MLVAPSPGRRRIVSTCIIRTNRIIIYSKKQALKLSKSSCRLTGLFQTDTMELEHEVDVAVLQEALNEQGDAESDTERAAKATIE